MDSGIPDSAILDRMTSWFGMRMPAASPASFCVVLLVACGPDRPPTGIVHDPNERQRDLAAVEEARRQKDEDDRQDALDRRQIRARRLEAERREQEARDRVEAERREKEESERRAALDAAAKAEADAREAEERRTEAAKKAAACAAVRRTKCTADCQGNSTCVAKCLQKAAPCN